MTNQESVHEIILRLAGLDVANVDEKFKLQITCSKDLPEIDKNRLRIWFEFNAQGKSIDGCNVLTKFDNIKLLSSQEKNSASKASIFLAEFNKKPIALKLFFDPKINRENYRDKSLLAEKAIYASVVNTLLLCGQTPHVLVFYAELQCKEYLTHLEKSDNQLEKQFFEEISVAKRKEENKKLNFKLLKGFVIERCLGKSLTDMFSAEYEPEHDQLLFDLHYLPVTFQILYTLALFSEIGLAHNDLHTGNILVERYDPPLVSRYLIAGKLYEIKSKYMARFFDFDHSAKIATKYNDIKIENSKLTAGKSCQNFGQCETPNIKGDMFTLMYYIYANNKNPLLLSLIESIIPKEYLLRPSKQRWRAATPGETFVFPGRLCVCKDKLCDECIPIEDPKILSPIDALQLPAFENLLVKDITAPSNVFVWALPSQQETQLYKSLQK